MKQDYEKPELIVYEDLTDITAGTVSVKMHQNKDLDSVLLLKYCIPVPVTILTASILNCFV